MKDLGIVVIDDFHRLDDKTKHMIADFLKELADREDPKTKIVLIGINKAGDSLVSFAADLNNRLDTIPFEVNEVNKGRELIAKGEAPADLPIEQPSKFTFVINLKAAKALGVTMPPSLITLADKVIE
jgi:hypothetical protein